MAYERKVPDGSSYRYKDQNERKSPDGSEFRHKQFDVCFSATDEAKLFDTFTDENMSSSTEEATNMICGSNFTCTTDVSNTDILSWLASTSSYSNAKDQTDYSSNTLSDSSSNTEGRCSASGTSSDLFEATDLVCQSCSVLNDAIPSEESAAFWRSVDETDLRDDRCHIKLWSKFFHKMEESFPQEPALKYSKTVHLLKTLFKVDHSDELAVIEYRNFVRAVTFFGPVKKTREGRCIMVQQVHDISKKSSRYRDHTRTAKLSWFAGDISREQTNEKLKTEKTGTYLIRMSTTEKGCFVISVVGENDCVHHFQIEADFKVAAKSDPFSAMLIFNGHTYHSLVELESSLTRQDLYDDESGTTIKCQYICPDLPLNGVISGYKKSRGEPSSRI